MANELKDFCVIVARCHVLIHLGNENDLSGVALVAGFINSKLQRTIMFGISCLSSGNNCNLSAISEKHTTVVSLKRCVKMGASLHQGSKCPLYRNNFIVSFSCHYDLVFYHLL